MQFDFDYEIGVNVDPSWDTLKTAALTAASATAAFDYSPYLLDWSPRRIHLAMLLFKDATNSGFNILYILTGKDADVKDVTQCLEWMILVYDWI